MRFKVTFSGTVIFLTIMLIILRVFNIINCSWVWVFTPIWFPITLLLIAVGVIYVFSWLLFRDMKGELYKKLKYND